MMDWLRAASETPTVSVNGRDLPVSIRRHPRARRMTMRLAPDGSEVRITLPTWGRALDALLFVTRRTQWLEQQLAKVPTPARLTVGGTVSYRGEPLPIAWQSALPRKPALASGVIQLGGPEQTVPARLQRWLEGEALRLLREDLGDYCAKASLPLPDLRLSRAQRRWGSCSGSGCIRLNWRLIQAPDPVRRSVVAHEVAHLVHFDHSPAFHSLLQSLFEGDLPAADGWLRREGRSLYTAFG